MSTNYKTRNSNDDALNDLTLDILSISEEKGALRDRIARLIDEYVDEIAQDAMNESIVFGYVDSKTLRVGVYCGAGSTIRPDGLEDSLFRKEVDLDELLGDVDFTGLGEPERTQALLKTAEMLEVHAVRLRTEASTLET